MVDVSGLMGQLEVELAEFVAIESVSSPGAADAQQLAACEYVCELFRGAGVSVSTLELPETAPVVTGEIPAPPGAPTVLLYSHYDVVPAGDPAAWSSPPFTLTERDGAFYGRGSADTKSNVLMHVGALRAWEGRPPVGIKLLIEGSEEVGSGRLLDELKNHRELFAADVLVIGDEGSITPGTPTLTTALRGTCEVLLEAQTLDSPAHSGVFGGAAPDALTALIRVIASLHDEQGDLVVPGLRREQWPGRDQDEAQFRALGGVLDSAPLVGSGGLGSRVWTGPAITPTGIDAPSVEHAVNAVNAAARAVLSVRVHPEQDPAEAQRAVIEHVEQVRPFGIEVSATPGMVGAGFRARSDGPAYTAAREAWRNAWGAEPVEAGSGGSIPVVSALAGAFPDAEVLLVGTADGQAGIHGPDERVLASEFQAATAALAEFFGLLAKD